MARIFKDRGINPKGLVLPLKDFKMFCELEGFQYDPDKMGNVVKSAEEMLSEEIPFLPLSLYRDYQLTGNRVRYQALVNRRKLMALTLAMAESYEKKGRFTEKLMDVVWAIMEESTWLYPAHVHNSPYIKDNSIPPVFGDNASHGVALCSAGISGTLALVLYLCRDALDAITPLICEKIIYSLNERMIKPFISGSFWWMGYIRKTNNWCPWIVSNALLCAAVAVEDDYVRERVVIKALEYLDNYTDSLPDDGGCDEGPGYWNAAGASLFDCLELIYDMTGGRIDVFSHPAVKAIGEYVVTVNICGRRFVNFADGPSKNSPDTALLMRYGSKCGSEPLRTLGASLSREYGPSLDVSKAYRTLRAFTTKTPEGCDMVAKERSYLKDLKVMAVRESSNPKKGLFLGMKGGTNGEMHNHNDVGNFVIYNGGEPVVIDAGVGTYTKQTFSSRRYELWIMQSGYHNLPSFGGVDQQAGERYCSCDEKYSEKSRSLQMELKNAYPESAGIISYIRKAQLKDGKVVIRDTLALKREKKVVFHLLTHREPIVTSKGIILNTGVLLKCDPALEVKIESFSSDTFNSKSIWGTEKMYRICMCTKVKEGSFTTTITVPKDQ